MDYSDDNNEWEPYANTRINDLIDLNSSELPQDLEHLEISEARTEIALYRGNTAVPDREHEVNIYHWHHQIVEEIHLV